MTRNELKGKIGAKLGKWEEVSVKWCIGLYRYTLLFWAALGLGMSIYYITTELVETGWSKHSAPPRLAPSPTADSKIPPNNAIEQPKICSANNDRKHDQLPVNKTIRIVEILLMGVLPLITFRALTVYARRDVTDEKRDKVLAEAKSALVATLATLTALYLVNAVIDVLGASAMGEPWVLDMWRNIFSGVAVLFALTTLYWAIHAQSARKSRDINANQPSQPPQK